MDSKLKQKAIGACLLAPLFFGVPIFIAAGTLHYWEAWLFIAVYTLAGMWHTLYIANHSPELLERRMRVGPSKEKRPAQKIIMCLVIAAFIGLIIVAGLDHRFGWSHVPAPVVILANVVLVLCFAIFNRVCKENTFASATIELAKEQKVISTGPYGLVRHPMYSGAVLLSLAMPIALGSYWGVLLVFALLPGLIWRIFDEEKFLLVDLGGYKEYCEKVRYRLIPGLF